MSDCGAFWRKPTCILHSTPVLHLLILEMDWALPVVPLRGQIWFQGAMVFLSSPACAYSPVLGECVGRPGAQLRVCVDEQGRYGSPEHDDGHPLAELAPTGVIGDDLVLCDGDEEGGGLIPGLVGSDSGDEMQVVLPAGEGENDVDVDPGVVSTLVSGTNPIALGCNSRLDKPTVMEHVRWVLVIR